MDVSALYSNIPVNDGIRATLKLLEAHQDNVDTLDFSLDDIRALLDFVLKNSYFRFGEDVYRQKMGVAMGNRLVPLFAIIFMHDLETRILETSSDRPSMWVRYIDDVFGVWQHGLASLDLFHEFVNNQHPLITFSIDHSKESPSIPFLDVSVEIAQDGSIRTELYIKPTHSGILPNYDSAHPQSTKMAIAESQIRRAACVANSDGSTKRGSLKIASMLRSNGYPENTIRRAHFKSPSPDNIPKRKERQR